VFREHTLQIPAFRAAVPTAQAVDIRRLAVWQTQPYISHTTCRQTSQNVLEIGTRIRPVHARRLDQAHDRRSLLTAAQRPGEALFLPVQGKMVSDGDHHEDQQAGSGDALVDHLRRYRRLSQSSH